MLQYERNFYITALPRSRTAWLSNLFCTYASFCYHEGIERYGTLPDHRPQRYIGTAETVALHIPTTAQRILIIHRSVEDSVKSSVEAFDIPDIDKDALSDMAFTMFTEQANYMSNLNGLHIEFCELEDKLEEIWTYLLPEIPFDKEYVAEVNKMNIQLNSRSLGDF